MGARVKKNTGRFTSLDILNGRVLAAAKASFLPDDERDELVKQLENDLNS